jgi:ADP-ribose pyrophosphatase YjhB (NUDIX family)
VTDTPKHSVSVAAVVFDDSREQVLLIRRRDTGDWQLPGGVLELDEQIEEGLRREVREETGAEIEIGPLTGVYKNMKRGVVALVFRCELQSKPMPTSREASAIEWHALNDALAQMSETFAIRVVDALACTASVRTHDGQRLQASQAWDARS